MKLACDLIKPWLVPFSEGTLRAHRPSLHAAVRRHLSGCASCRQDEVLLHKTAMALRKHGQKSPSWKWPKSRAELSQDFPLSSRVLQSVQAERHNLACRASRTARRAYPLVAYATSVGFLCVFFAFLTQPSIARPWFERYFLSQHQTGRAAKHGPVAPPYPMHDPFAIPVANYSDSSFEPRTANPSSHKARAAFTPPVYGHPVVDPFTFAPTPAQTSGDVQAREAMTTAEQAEETRNVAKVANPAPVAPKIAASAGFAVTPVAHPTPANLTAPIVAGRSVVTSSSAGNGATGSALPTAAQPKSNVTSSGPATVKTVPPIPDAVPPSATGPAADSLSTTNH